MQHAITAPKNFFDTPDFEYTCPKCNVGFLIPDQSTFKKIEPRYSETEHEHSAWEPEWITHRFVVICVCNKKDCGEVAFVSGSGNVETGYDNCGNFESFERFTIKTFFPSPRLCYIPSETPSEVENLLEKSFAFYWVEVSAAANSLRASLEALLDEKEVPTQEENRKGKMMRMNLHRRLDVWAETHKEHAELCYAIKELGNLGSHGKLEDPKYYLEALEIYSHVLKALFDNTDQKMNELAKSILDGIKVEADRR